MGRGWGRLSGTVEVGGACPWAGGLVPVRLCCLVRRGGGWVFFSRVLVQEPCADANYAQLAHSSLCSVLTRERQSNDCTLAHPPLRSATVVRVFRPLPPFSAPARRGRGAHRGIPTDGRPRGGGGYRLRRWRGGGPTPPAHPVWHEPRAVGAPCRLAGGGSAAATPGGRRSGGGGGAPAAHRWPAGA